MWVAKFGGSSIPDANGIVNCARLALAQPGTGVIVLSATQNTTNLLEQASDFKQIQERHQHIVEELGLSQDVIADISEEAQSLHPGQKARWCALGEALSSAIFAAHLTTVTDRPVSLLDARRLIVTDGAVPIIEQIASRCRSELSPLLKRGHLVVTQGFIASSLAGETALLGREGSDYSATLLAEAIGAKGVTIWSDVPGVFSADPNLVPEARLIPRLSYPTAKTLAQCGAKVLFPQTLDPAERQNIPVLVRSSLEPAQEGTRISADTSHAPGPLALVLKQNKLSLIGEHIDTIPIKLPEVERGERHRTFAIQGDHHVRVELLRQWHRHFFYSYSQVQ